MSTDLTSYLRVLTGKAGILVAEGMNHQHVITEKTSVRDVVTECDVAVQDFLMTNIDRDWPGCTFLCEENNVLPANNPDVFVIDPIDGTTNFVKKFRECCISIGFVQNGTATTGVIHSPIDGETWYASRGEGSWLDRGEGFKPERLHVSTPASFEGTVVSFGLGHTTTGPSVDLGFSLTRELFCQNVSLRRAGSAALNLCYTARGTWDLMYDLALSPWDFAAGTVIVEEAGGITRTLEGAPVNPLEKSGIVAGEERLVESLLAMVRGYSDR